MYYYYLSKMKDKIFIGIIGGISIVATGIPIYNYYILPVIRDKEISDKRKEIIDKIYGFYN